MREATLTALANSQANDGPTIDEEDALRAAVYDLLSALLRREPDAALLKQAAALSGDGTPLGQAFNALAAVARKISPEVAKREYLDLCIGLGRGELMPFASYYLTGFLNEKPLALLRADMMQLSIERRDDVYEPEDHIASLMEMMAGLIRGRFGDPLPMALQRKFFETHLAPWAGPFFSDVEKAETSVLYAPVGTIGRLFMEIEAAAFGMEK